MDSCSPLRQTPHIKYSVSEGFRFSDVQIWECRPVHAIPGGSGLKQEREWEFGNNEIGIEWEFKAEVRIGMWRERETKVQNINRNEK